MKYERKDMCGIMGITRVTEEGICETVHFSEPKKNEKIISMFMYGDRCEACIPMTEEDLEQLQELIGDVLGRMEKHKEVRTFAGLKKKRHLTNHSFVLHSDTWIMKLLWSYYDGNRYEVVFLDDIEEMLYGEDWQLENLLDAFEEELGKAGLTYRDVVDDEDVLECPQIPCEECQHEELCKGDKSDYEILNLKALEYIRQRIVNELIEYNVGSIKYDW